VGPGILLRKWCVVYYLAAGGKSLEVFNATLQPK